MENNKGDQYICKRVRAKIIDYLESKLQCTFNEFYRQFGNENGDIIIDFQNLKSVTCFNKKGNIQRDEKEMKQNGNKIYQFDPYPSISTKYFNMQYYIEQDKCDLNEQREFQSINNSFMMNNIQQNMRKNRFKQTRKERRDRVDYYQQCRQLEREHHELQREIQLLRQELKCMNIDYHYYPSINVEQSIQQMSSSSDNGECGILMPDISNGTTISDRSNSSNSSNSSNHYITNQLFDDSYSNNVLLSQHIQCPAYNYT